MNEVVRRSFALVALAAICVLIFLGSLYVRDSPGIACSHALHDAGLTAEVVEARTAFFGFGLECKYENEGAVETFVYNHTTWPNSAFLLAGALLLAAIPVIAIRHRHRSDRIEADVTR